LVKNLVFGSVRETGLKTGREKRRQVGLSATRRGVGNKTMSGIESNL